MSTSTGIFTSRDKDETPYSCIYTVETSLKPCLSTCPNC